MPVYRTPDGRIVEEKTQRFPRNPVEASEVPPDRAAADRDKTTLRGAVPPVGRSDRPGPRVDAYDAPTVARRPGAAPGDEATHQRSADGGAERTRLAGGIPARQAEADEPGPVAGWLVVVEGPGVGRDVRIGIGRNALGRDPGNRIALPFGDTEISRTRHLWVTYDHLNRVFSVAPGDSNNLAYLDGDAIEERRPLVDGATIRVGRTILRFAAFCGEQFTWSDAD